jgi:hypothetical protein
MKEDLGLIALLEEKRTAWETDNTQDEKKSSKR